MSRLFVGFTCLLAGVMSAPTCGAAQRPQAELTRVAVGVDGSGSALPEAPEPQPQGTAAGPNSAASTSRDGDLSIAGTPKRLLLDEWGIVRAPAHIRTHDLRWLLPVVGVTAAALATDSHVMRSVVTHDPGTLAASDRASGDMRDVLIGVPIAMFGVGQLTSHQRPRDAGLLAGEAMINAIVTDEGIKYLTLRERPDVHDGRGHFFSSDAFSDPSFVSGHAIVAWSSAAALAGEYSKPWQQISLYTLASGVSVTRLVAQQHFPTDVLLGSACGWFIGRYVYRNHHRTR